MSSSRISREFPPHHYPSQSRSQSNSHIQSQYQDQNRYSTGYEQYNSPSGLQYQQHPLYHETPDDVDEPFDVRADFDGDGRKWSQRFGSGGNNRESMMMEKDLSERGSYQPVQDHLPPSRHDPKHEAASREELVSVPVLGPEWQRTELHDMSRRGKSEVKKDARNQKWKAWTRDQRGLCGINWLTRKVLVFILFFLVVATALALYFTIPRPAAFAFYVPEPFSVDNSTIVFSRAPTNFTFSGNLNLLADTTGSYLPTHFSDISINLYDLDTNKMIGTGNFGDHTVKKGQEQPLVIPVTFNYTAINATDQTWNNMYNACGHLWPGTTRPDLKFRLVLTSSIVGLVTQPKASTQLSDITCPFQLPTNSV